VTARPLGRRLGAAGVAASVLYSSALVFLRGRPSIEADAGIFVSVAARIVHGDHLYTGVWDNKPPFFYYGQALALDVAGWRGPFLLDAVWLSIATISIWLLLRRVGLPTWTSLVGAAVYPLMLTGAWYYAGFSELPALALAPLIGWLCLRRSIVAAGAVTGIAIFFRLDYGLVFLALIAAPLVLGWAGTARLRADALRLLAGFAATAGASIAFLAARGELGAYVDTLRSQVGYPDRALAQQGEPAGIPGHVAAVGRIFLEDRARGVLFVVVLAALAALLIPMLRRRGRTALPEPVRGLAGLMLATGAAAAVTLALTGLWDHSLELLALPATFGSCLLIWWLESSLRRPARLVAATLLTVTACAVAFGGISTNSPGSPEAGSAISQWWNTPRSVSAEALDRAAAGSTATITYARLGQNADDGHAAFVEENLELVCPVFHQYPFSANLDEALSCVRDDEPQLILVGPRFAPLHESATESWDSFVSAGRQLLRNRYERAVKMPDGGEAVEVWKRR
jgi:hypothetical protein